MRRSLTIGSLLLSLAPALAMAWTSSSPFSATVHQHKFHHIEAKADLCKVHSTLKFGAPDAAYQEPAKTRNYYRFKARVRFASGKHIVSKTFFSKAPGNHQYEFDVDTKSDGCWSKAVQKVVGVDVEGCRGRGCQVRPFQN